jgi:small subunit ribosomal protein S16
MLAKDAAGRVTLNQERIKHWMSVGALPSERVARFLFEAGMGPKPMIREQPKKSAPRAKRQEREKGGAAGAGAALAAAPTAAPAPAEAPAS